MPDIKKAHNVLLYIGQGQCDKNMNIKGKRNWTPIIQLMAKSETSRFFSGTKLYSKKSGGVEESHRGGIAKKGET